MISVFGSLGVDIVILLEWATRVSLVLMDHIVMISLEMVAASTLYSFDPN